MEIKKQQLEPDMEQQTGSKSGKEYVKAVYCHPAHLTFVQNTSCEMQGWMNHKVVIKFTDRNINQLRYADDTTLMAEREKELKNLLMRMTEESEKAGLKLSIQNIKIMASSPIISWQIDGDTVETVTDLFSWAPKSLWMVTTAMELKDACSLEEKL